MKLVLVREGDEHREGGDATAQVDGGGVGAVDGGPVLKGHGTAQVSMGTPTRGTPTIGTLLWPQLCLILHWLCLLMLCLLMLRLLMLCLGRYDAAERTERRGVSEGLRESEQRAIHSKY